MGSLSKEDFIKNSGVVISRHLSTYNESTIDENVRFVKEIIDIAENRNIRLILITAPTTIYYRNNFDKHIIDLFYDIIKTICDDYKNVNYYDFSNAEFNDDDFLNSDHLNYIGAKKFSKMLNSILE